MRHFAGLAGQAWVLAPRRSSLRTSVVEDGRLLLSNSTQVWERRGTVLMTGEGIRRSPASAVPTKVGSATLVAAGAACVCQPAEQPAPPQRLAAGTTKLPHVARSQELAPQLKETIECILVPAQAAWAHPRAGPAEQHPHLMPLIQLALSC